MKELKLHESVFIADGAKVLGDVVMGEDSSVWYNAVIRADNARVTIGKQTNIQDGAIIHVDPDSPVKIGDGVVVGHGAIIHACTVGDHSLVGMGAIILNDAVIGNDCLIGAGALVTGGTLIPDGMLVLGSPAKVIRPVTEAEKAHTRESAEGYAAEAKQMKAEQKN